MKTVSGLLVVALCLGLVGCATASAKKEATSAYVPLKDQPMTAQQYWNGRDAQDKAARLREQQQGVSW